MRARSVPLLLLAVAVFVGCGSSKKKDEPAAAPTSTDEVDSAPPPKPPDCVHSTPLMAFDGSLTGFESCDGGVTHRSSVHTCPSKLPRTTTCPNGACSSDAECTTKPNGFCGTSPRSASCFCNYGCTTDTDCGAGMLCECGDPVGHCVKASCASDADCGGLLCLRSIEGCEFAFACQQPTDGCTSNLDCTNAVVPACTLDGGKRSCQPLGKCQ